MGFSDFHGNAQVVTQLREMLSRRRLPQGIIMAGPAGAGKYTLAQMMAKAMNCLSPPTEDLPDFCGKCVNCSRIGQADDLEARFAEAVEAREGLREADKKDTRILIQTHPDVLVIPPDPPQMMIKIDQVRHVAATIYFRPTDARERVYIFTDSAFMKEAANSLLKVLEEPPEFATLFLLTTNAGELLPTIRSRSMTFNLEALPASEVEKDLAQRRSEWSAKQRALVARLSGGAIGCARAFDLAAYVAARKDALVLLHTAIQGSDHSELFRTTETYRAGAEGKEKSDRLIHALYQLLEDLLFLKEGAKDLVRNTDIAGDLEKLAASVGFEWVAIATQGLDEVRSGMRRNLLRSLSLDAFAISLEPQ